MSRKECPARLRCLSGQLRKAPAEVGGQRWERAQLHCWLLRCLCALVKSMFPGQMQPHTRVHGLAGAGEARW